MSEIVLSNVCGRIGYAHPSLRARAEAYALQYGFEISNESLPRLEVQADKLVLQTRDFLPMFVDFSSESIKRRLDAGKKQGLIRACKPKLGMKIIDATAGWGRDAAILAHFGASVILLERQPMMAALLSDGLERANSSQLSLVHTDAVEYLSTLEPSNYPDVIYIDPMHPSRHKSALVKKEMQVLQQLFGPDEAVDELIQLALMKTKHNVVLKWPQRLPPMMKPHTSVAGKTIRFDVFHRF